MLRIATHNSASGEKSSFWSHLVTLVSRTQDKTLVGQWNAGCRYFDLRFRCNRKGTWHFCHGLWRSKHSVEKALLELNTAASADRVNKTYAYFTYEGKYANAMKKNFLAFCEECDIKYQNILITSIDAKYSGEKNPFVVDYKNIARFNYCPIGSHPQGFIALDGKHWQTLLPIPRLWNWIYTRHHNFDEEKFLFVDFL